MRKILRDGALLTFGFALAAGTAPFTRTAAAEEAEAAAAPAEEAAKESWLPGSLAGNVTIISDYSFRGVSQTNRETAIQGGIDWSHDSGVHLGTWGSNVNFGNTAMEGDFYGGYAGEASGLTYDVLATFFYYPGDEQFNYWEFILKLGYDFGAFKLSSGVVGSPDYYGLLDTGFYVPAGIAVPIPFDFQYFDLTADANFGYTKTNEFIYPGTHHYYDWNMGVVAAFPFNLSLNMRYVDTTVNQGVRDAGARFVIGATYAF